MSNDNRNGKLHLPPGVIAPARKAFPYTMHLRYGPDPEKDTSSLTFHADGTMSGDVGKLQEFLDRATVDIPAPMLIQLWLIRSMLPQMEKAESRKRRRASAVELVTKDLGSHLLPR